MSSFVCFSLITVVLGAFFIVFLAFVVFMIVKSRRKRINNQTPKELDEIIIEDKKEQFEKKFIETSVNSIDGNTEHFVVGNSNSSLAQFTTNTEVKESTENKSNITVINCDTSKVSNVIRSVIHSISNKTSDSEKFEKTSVQCLHSKDSIDSVNTKFEETLSKETNINDERTIMSIDNIQSNESINLNSQKINLTSVPTEIQSLAQQTSEYSQSISNLTYPTNEDQLDKVFMNNNNKFDDETTLSSQSETRSQLITLKILDDLSRINSFKSEEMENELNYNSNDTKNKSDNNVSVLPSSVDSQTSQNTVKEDDTKFHNMLLNDNTEIKKNQKSIESKETQSKTPEKQIKIISTTSLISITSTKQNADETLADLSISLEQSKDSLETQSQSQKIIKEETIDFALNCYEEKDKRANESSPRSPLQKSSLHASERLIDGTMTFKRYSRRKQRRVNEDHDSTYNEIIRLKSGSLKSDAQSVIDIEYVTPKKNSKVPRNAIFYMQRNSDEIIVNSLHREEL